MNHYKYKATVNSMNSQEGSVLLWGLVILLTLTVIGVSAARMGVTDIRIAGNQIFGAMTYQSAESALQRVRKEDDRLYYIKKTDETVSDVESWDFTETVNDGETNSAVTISMAGSIQCPPVEGAAGSVEMVSDSYSCLLYTVDSRARLAGTGARSRHSMGVTKFAPAASGAAP